MSLPVFGTAFTLFLVAVLWFVVPKLVLNAGRAAATIQGIYRTNIALFGLPLAVNLFGEQNVGDVVLMIAVMVPLFNVIAVVVLSSFSESSQKPSVSSIFRDIVKNRLIWGVLLGLAVAMTGIRLPDVILKPITELGATATPLAMLSLGGQFSFKSAVENRTLLLASCLMRLVVVPALAVAAGLAVGFSGLAIGALFIVFGAPTATSSFVMAKSMGADGELAGEIVVFTTMLSILTVFIGTYLLKSTGII